MKGIFTLLACIMLLSTAKSQTNTGILEITLDVNQLAGTCKLAGVDTVYIHSGLGWSNPDSVWQSIVGSWGLDDGKGRMTNLGNGVHSICFNVKDYYTNLATKDSTSPTGEGYGPLPAGETPYNIGAVFRTASCPYSPTTRRPECTPAQTGKDGNCENVYILGINDPATMAILDNAGNEFPALTARYITECAGVSSGINDMNPSFVRVLAYPVPFNNTMRIEFEYLEGAKPKVEILNTIGQKVANFSAEVHKGFNSFAWNGKDMNGGTAPAGLYLLQISNGDQSYTAKLIKQ